MTTEKHTPLAFGAALDADVLNEPLGELDSAIVAVEGALAQTALPATLTDASAGSGQKVVPVASTDGFIVGQTIWIGDVGGTFEVAVIASIQAGISLTVVTNLTNTYAAGKIVSASPAELVAARNGFASLDARLAAGIGSSGAAFPVTPASGDLFRHTGRSGAMYRYTGAAWVQINVPAVTAFWGTPSTNDRCYRTDRGLEYFYDGTRWLTTTLHTAPFSLQRVVNPLSLTGHVHEMASPHPSYQVYIEHLFGHTLVAAPNDASNNWSVAMSGLVVFTTSADAAAAWVNKSFVRNTVHPNPTQPLGLTVTKTGAPGNIFLVAAATLRYVG